MWLSVSEINLSSLLFISSILHCKEIIIIIPRPPGRGEAWCDLQWCWWMQGTDWQTKGGCGDSIATCTWYSMTITCVGPSIFPQPEKFVKLGIEPPKGVLLFGPPGTGKTLCARAVANRTDACFIRVIGSELVQKYVGEVSYTEHTHLAGART